MPEEIKMRKRVKRRPSLIIPWCVDRAEVTDTAWQELVDDAMERGVNIRRATRVWLDISDIETDDAGPEAVELMEEEHCGGD